MRQKRDKQLKLRLDISAVTIRFTAEGEVLQNLTDRHSGKTKQMTNWSVSTFQGRLKVFHLKLLNIKLELSTENLK